jgi:hypothetical protein
MESPAVFAFRNESENPQWTLTSEMVMKDCRLCHYTKSDGNLCCAPAMKRRPYCHFHSEAVRREKRMARCRLRTRLAANQVPPIRAMEIKDLVSKVFDMKILRGIARLNPELGGFCEEWGEGGMGRLNGLPKTSAAHGLEKAHRQPIADS